MANLLIGLDFGTSQTKICIVNTGNNIREFLKFENDSFFLPSLVVLKSDHTFSYGDENEKGIKYRYFKMAAAEDDQLIQITNEDLYGNLPSNNIDEFRKYSSESNIKPEVLVVLYLTYIFLYVKKKKKTVLQSSNTGLFGRLSRNAQSDENEYSINLGIPTEWNNPNHIKRKLKFESLLLTVYMLSNKFEDLDQFVKTKRNDLFEKITKINNENVEKILNNTNSDLLKEWLIKHNLSVFPESAAGINYLLKTKRLKKGAFATIDIGAGTTDIAIFEVQNYKLSYYYCSESTSIASNDFYKEYAKKLHDKETISFDEIKKAEQIIRNESHINSNLFNRVAQIVRGDRNDLGIEFAIRKTFFRKYFFILYKINKFMALNELENIDKRPIIVFGGGANIKGFSTGNYCFYKGSNPFGNYDRYFKAKPITDFVPQVDIIDNNDSIKKDINLLILALGLTYVDKNATFIPFHIPDNNIYNMQNPSNNNNRYFYYDLQDAAYK